jgi:hypothetical protein
MATVTTSSASVEYSSSFDTFLSGLKGFFAAVSSCSIEQSPAGGTLGQSKLAGVPTGVLQAPTQWYYLVTCVDSGFGRRSWIALSPLAASALAYAPTPTGTYDSATFVIEASWLQTTTT